MNSNCVRRRLKHHCAYMRRMAQLSPPPISRRLRRNNKICSMFNQIIDQFYRARQHAKCDIDIPIYVSPTRRGTILCLNERSYRQFFDHVVETSLGFTPVFCATSSLENSTAIRQRGRKIHGVGKICDFRPISPFISVDRQLLRITTGSHR